jgi:hypothetical protein
LPPLGIPAGALMITILRKHHRWLMIVISILALPFVFYFVQKPDYSALNRKDDLGRIYDRTITQVEFTRNARLLNLASGLGLSLGNDLMTGQVTSESEMYVEFTWNRLILRHEADELGIHPSSSEITAYVKAMPRFKGDAGFDINKYNEFTKGLLPSLGFTEAQIEELVSDQLSLAKVKEIVGTGMQISDAESKENYEKAYGKLDVAVVRLRDEDFQKDVNITDEEIAKYYEAHKATLKSEEKRKIEFVTFALSDTEKKLTGKDRTEPLQKVADKANDFTQALLEKDANFGAVASKLQIPVVATDEFTAVTPDPKLVAIPQLTQSAFLLTQQAPFSDPIQGPDGFYVAHLLGVTESHPLTLDESKAKMVETMKSERLREVMTRKGTEVTQRIRAALKAKTPVEAAVQQSGLKLERVPEFALMEAPTPKPAVDKPAVDKKEPKNEPPDLSTIRSVVAPLEPGQVSDFTPVSQGGLIAVLEKRAPADPAGFATAKTTFETRYLTQRRGAAFVEWMRERRREAGVVVSTG